METIKVGEKIIAIIHRENDWSKGLDFLTDNDLNVQVGTWWYDKGKSLDRHLHNTYDRLAKRTQEMVYVKQGLLLVKLYDDDKNYIQDTVLNTGDIGIFVNGGHGYEILEDNTMIIEAKNGPFTNVSKDKTKF